MHYRYPLLLTDNLSLAIRIKALLNEMGIDDHFSFGISPFSNLETFKMNLDNPLVFDLKDEETIDKLIHNYDLILSIHCKQLFPERLITSVKCINIHPGYNPYNRGWYPQVFSIIHDLPIGATIHEIDSQIDHGNIIARKLVDKKSYDTSETLYNRVTDAEIDLVRENLRNILDNRYNATAPEKEGDLYLKKDFNSLLQIDLNEKMTAHEFIDRYRALTHGKFRNAYFFDPQSGKKIYLSINLLPE